MKQKNPKPELYGTRQVATILGIPEWRVKNFTEGEAYGLSPSIQVGSGRGSRRLYGREDIFRIGLADTLVKFGFAPDAVGEAVREVPETVLKSYAVLRNASLEHKLYRKDTHLLVNSDGQWKLRMGYEALADSWQQTLQAEGSIRALFVIDLAKVFDTILSRLQKQLETGLNGE